MPHVQQITAVLAKFQSFATFLQSSLNLKDYSCIILHVATGFLGVADYLDITQMAIGNSKLQIYSLLSEG